MSKTPICDRWEYDSYSGGLVVPLNVAKDLETELAEARAEVEHWRKHIESARAAILELNKQLVAAERESLARAALIQQMSDAIGEALGVLPSGYKEREKCMAALEAAERP